MKRLVSIVDKSVASVHGCRGMHVFPGDDLCPFCEIANLKRERFIFAQAYDRLRNMPGLDGHRGAIELLDTLKVRLRL